MFFFLKTPQKENKRAWVRIYFTYTIYLAVFLFVVPFLEFERRQRLFTDRTRKLPPPPPRSSLPCMQCSLPCKHEVQDRARVALKRCSLPRWQPGALRFWGRWGSRHFGVRSGVRKPAGPPRGSPHSSAEAALPDTAERTHEPAPPRSAWEGTGTLVATSRAHSGPGGVRRGQAASGAVEFSRPAPVSPPRSCAAWLPRLLRRPPCPEPKPDRPARLPASTRAAGSLTYRPGSRGSAAILEPRQHRAFSLAEAAQPIGCDRSGSVVAQATAELA